MAKARVGAERRPVHQLEQSLPRARRADDLERDVAVADPVHDHPRARGPVTSGSPVLLRQERMGLDGRRFSLDEPPQPLNVFCGEMSLVGPRPERQPFVEEFRRKAPCRRLCQYAPPGSMIVKTSNNPVALLTLAVVQCASSGV